MQIEGGTTKSDREERGREEGKASRRNPPDATLYPPEFAMDTVEQGLAMSERARKQRASCERAAGEERRASCEWARRGAREKTERS